MNRYLCTASLLVLLLAACGTTSSIQPVSKPRATVAASASPGKPTVLSRRDLLDFVIDGYTTCNELHDHLGSPS
jgi:hypothetical protein